MKKKPRENYSSREDSKSGTVPVSIPATDANGHSARLAFRIPPSVVKQIEIAIASGETPFRTTSEIIRHAVVRYLQELLTDNPKIPSHMASINAMIELLTEEQRMLDFRQIFDRLSDVISKHQMNGSQLRARQVVTQFKLTIDTMPDSFWKELYTKALMERFGYLLSTPDSGANFTDIE